MIRVQGNNEIGGDVGTTTRTEADIIEGKPRIIKSLRKHFGIPLGQILFLTDGDIVVTTGMATVVIGKSQVGQCEGKSGESDEG